MLEKTNLVGKMGFFVNQVLVVTGLNVIRYFLIYKKKE